MAAAHFQPPAAHRFGFAAQRAIGRHFCGLGNSQNFFVELGRATGRCARRANVQLLGQWLVQHNLVPTRRVFWTSFAEFPEFRTDAEQGDIPSTAMMLSGCAFQRALQQNRRQRRGEFRLKTRRRSDFIRQASVEKMRAH